jgi:hypothetical protein
MKKQMNNFIKTGKQLEFEMNNSDFDFKQKWVSLSLLKGEIQKKYEYSRMDDGDKIKLNTETNAVLNWIMDLLKNRRLCKFHKYDIKDDYDYCTYDCEYLGEYCDGTMTGCEYYV